ncbi:MAG: hypothetical protein AABN33_27905 [Acidobacteriota bacterium]
MKERPLGEKPVGDIEPHDLMRLLIPDGKLASAGQMLGVSESQVSKWRREPASDDNVNGTGYVGPLDRLDRLYDFVLLYCPENLPLLRDRYAAKFDQHLSKKAGEPIDQGELELRLGAGVRELSEVVALVIEGSSGRELRKQWEAAKARIEEIVRRREKADFGFQKW